MKIDLVLIQWVVLYEGSIHCLPSQVRSIFNLLDTIQCCILLRVKWSNYWTRQASNSNHLLLYWKHTFSVTPLGQPGKEGDRSHSCNTWSSSCPASGPTRPCPIISSQPHVPKHSNWPEPCTSLPDVPICLKPFPVFSHPNKAWANSWVFDSPLLNIGISLAFYISGALIY